MKNLILLLLLLTFAGCVTQNKCNQKYPPVETIITKDSVIRTVETIYSDTTIYYQLPADTVTEVVEVERATQIKPSVLKTGYSISTAYVKEGRLYHSLIQNDTLLRLNIDNAVRSTWESASKFYNKETVKVERVRYIPKWVWLALGVALIALMGWAIKLISIFKPV